jgi:hypothetical protein
MMEKMLEKISMEIQEPSQHAIRLEEQKVQIGFTARMPMISSMVVQAEMNYLVGMEKMFFMEK